MASVYDVKFNPSGSLSEKMDDRGYVTGTVTREGTISLDDGTSDTVVSVKENSDLPRPNDPHPESLALRVIDVNVTQVSVVYYTFVVSYASPKRPEGTDEETQPTELEAEIEFSSITSDEATDEDIDGEPIVNLANDPIEGITIPISDLAVTITKNLLTFAPESIYEYNNTVNSDTFLGFPAGTARIIDIRARNAIKNDVPYWVVTVQIQFRKPYRTTDDKAWYKRVIHEGFKEINPKGSDLPAIPIKDGEGKDVTTPALLDSTGKRLENGGAAHWLEFPMHKTKAFSELGLF